MAASGLYGADRPYKALQGLLSYDKGAIAAVLASGMLPSLMASAVMPVPLVGIHQNEVLQTHVGLLEAMHREAATAARAAKAHAKSEQTRKARDRRLSTQLSASWFAPSDLAAHAPRRPLTLLLSGYSHNPISPMPHPYLC